MKANSHLPAIDLLPVIYNKHLPERYAVYPVINISENIVCHNQKIICSNEYGDEKAILRYGKEIMKGMVKIITTTNINAKGRYINVLV